MASDMRIAIDAMGGDQAPASIIAGALVAARHLQCGLLLVGARGILERELAKHPGSGSIDIDFVEASGRIEMGESAAAALRRKPDASIRVAAEAVKNGRADALFSAGHTGATVLAAHAAFGRIPGIERPALATIIPTRESPAVLLDSGASVECRPHHLVQFAVMGSAYARVALGCAPVRFIGNVEGPGVFRGEADVIVCDGFTGNVTLKIGEGLVEAVEALLHEELSATFGTRVGYLLSRQAYRRFRKRVDYSEYGGAPLVGLNGLCVVGHGRSSAKAVRNAVAMAARFAADGLVARLAHEVSLTPS